MKQILVELNDSAPIAQQMAECAREAKSGRYRSTLLHVYSGIPDEERLVQVTRELRDCCGTDLVVGTMSAGEIKDGHLMKQGILVSAIFFESSEVRVLRFDDVKDHEVEVGIRVCRALDEIPHLKGAELLFPGTETDTEHMFAQISKCRRDIDIFGGYPGGHELNSPEHFNFEPDGIIRNSVLVVTYAGEDLHFDMDKSIGWQPLGRPFKVTNADGKRLIELDGKPAANIYERFLHIDRTLHKNAEDVSEFPLLGRKDGENRLSAVIHIEEDGSLQLYNFVTDGMDIMLSYGDPTNIVKEVNERLEALRRFRPQVILLYSCVVRKTFWEDFVDMEMIPFADLCSTAGCHTWGEVLRNRENGEVGENNITLLSIGMREGDAPAGELPPARIDDTVLQGQASVLRRLTRLVSTTMEELQDTYAKLTYMAEHDALTGIYNRGKIESLINDALDQTAHDGLPVSLIMADIDHFKQINDTCGHDTGDAVLRRVAEILQEAADQREGAKVGRWGGEEFFVLLPGCVEDEAMAVARRIQLRVSANSLPDIRRLTISQGVITVRGESDRKDVYIRVDDALYSAKVGGRNRVVTVDSME